MFSKITAAAMVTLATVNAAEFLQTSAANSLEIYAPVSAPLVTQEELPVGDTQIGCQYLTGLYFYNLQPLYLQ